MTVTGEDDVESENDDTDDVGYDTDVNTDPRTGSHSSSQPKVQCSSWKV